MPDGAQAWKMIKTPGSHTDRIAQACDRCRSKKIRCDGKRPNCTQCVSVGFECKTSDKLSRRAFPRGYTESLEDRVRQLETENHKLLNLLDIKDEQMEMLSKVEVLMPGSRYSSAPSSTNGGSKASSVILDDEDDEEPYVVKQINTLSVDGTYKGSSAGGVFFEAFIEKLTSKKCTSIGPQISKLYDELASEAVSNNNTNNNNGITSGPYSPSKSEGFPVTPSSISSPSMSPPSIHGLHTANNSTRLSICSSPFVSLYLPSRLTCDQLVSTYFQEWHTMFAVIDQYAFLEVYHTFMDSLASAEGPNGYDAKVFEGKESFVVVLLLVLSLSSLCSRVHKPSYAQESWKLEQEWRRLFSPAIQRAPSLETCQALALALLYSLNVAHDDNIWYYRNMAISMCQRLGLHRCHKSLKHQDSRPVDFYNQEMRRRVFWVVHTLDCFAGAALGAPRLLHDKDVECALPSNIDDEMLRAGILPPTPQDTNKPLKQEPDLSTGKSAPSSTNGEDNTHMSCPLSVMHFAKVLANIMDTVYSCTKQNHTYKTIVTLEDQLETWRRELPENLKFDFTNGAPAASLTPLHQKSPLLLIMYHYARILIHLPAIAVPHDNIGSSQVSTRGSASCVAVMQSAKTFLQVVNYLRVRNVFPTLSMNWPRSEVFFGSIVLYGAVDYSKGGALLADVRKLLSASLAHLYSDLQTNRPGALNISCYMTFENICDVLLNTSHRAKSSYGSDDEQTGPESVRKISRPRSESSSGPKRGRKPSIKPTNTFPTVPVPITPKQPQFLQQLPPPTQQQVLQAQQQNNQRQQSQHRHSVAGSNASSNAVTGAINGGDSHIDQRRVHSVSSGPPTNLGPENSRSNVIDHLLYLNSLTAKTGTHDLTYIKKEPSPIMTNAQPPRSTGSNEGAVSITIPMSPVLTENFFDVLNDDGLLLSHLDDKNPLSDGTYPAYTSTGESAPGKQSAISLNSGSNANGNHGLDWEDCLNWAINI